MPATTGSAAKRVITHQSLLALRLVTERRQSSDFRARASPEARSGSTPTGYPGVVDDAGSFSLGTRRKTIEIGQEE